MKLTLSKQHICTVDFGDTPVNKFRGRGGWKGVTFDLSAGDRGADGGLPEECEAGPTASAQEGAVGGAHPAGARGGMTPPPHTHTRSKLVRPIILFGTSHPDL